jgi:membrane protein implicated in regulation of membrane protease activity
MNLNRSRLEKALLPLGFVFAALVIVAGTLQWPVALVYALTALMFAAVFGARSAERRGRREQ